MYVILTYDVNAKRVSKVMKICRKYLIHAQNSVFEGMLTQSQLQQLKAEIEKRVHPEEDSINIYVLQSTERSLAGSRNTTLLLNEYILSVGVVTNYFGK